MNLETTRLVTAALRDPVYGVNALLPGVPLSATDAAPLEAPLVTLSEHLVAEVANDYEAEWAARGEAPVDLPALLVLGETDGGFTPFSPMQSQLDAESVTVAIAYLSRDEIDLALGRRLSGYTLRAVRRSLVRWMIAANRDHSLRRESGIEVLRLKKLLEVRATGAVGRAALTGVVRGVFHVRDTSP